MQIPSALIQILLGRGLGNISFALFIKKNNHNSCIDLLTLLPLWGTLTYFLERRNELVNILSQTQAEEDQTESKHPNAFIIGRHIIRTILWIREWSDSRIEACYVNR